MTEQTMIQHAESGSTVYARSGSIKELDPAADICVWKMP